jgi:hypothetical protein
MSVIRFIVDASFQLTNRGAALVTSGDLSLLMPGVRYAISFVRGDGRSGSAFATREIFSRRTPVASESAAIVVINGRTEDFPPGSEVLVHLTNQEAS